MIWKLQGSAPGLDSMVRLLKDRWYWDVSLTPYTTDPNIFAVVKRNGALIEDCRVIKKRNRYRFEILVEGA